MHLPSRTRALTTPLTALLPAGSPSIVFLDEPTTGLDPETRRQIWNIIQAEKAMGRCMIITTHSMEEVREGVRLGGGG